MLHHHPIHTMMVFTDDDCFTFTLPSADEVTGRVITNPNELTRTRVEFEPPMRISDLFAGRLKDEQAYRIPGFLRLNEDDQPKANDEDRDRIKALYEKTFPHADEDGFEHWLSLLHRKEDILYPAARNRLKAQLTPPSPAVRRENQRLEKEFDATVRDLPFFVKLLAHAYVPLVFICKQEHIEHTHGRSNKMLGVFFYGGNHRSPETVTEEILHFVDEHILFYRRMNEINRKGKLDFIGEDAAADHFSLQPTFIAAVDADIAGLRTNHAAQSLLKSKTLLKKGERGNLFARKPQGAESRYFEALVDFINIYASVTQQVYETTPLRKPEEFEGRAEEIMSAAFPAMSLCFFSPPEGRMVGHDAQGRPVLKSADPSGPRFTPFMDLLKYRILNNEEIDIPHKHYSGDDAIQTLAEFNDLRDYIKESSAKDLKRPQRRGMEY